MSRPEQVIDLTGHRNRYIEILTDAGTIRVHAGMVRVRNARPVILIEAEVRTLDYPGRQGDGDWSVTVQRYQPADGRIEVALDKAP